jgi:hypothetical protein
MTQATMHVKERSEAIQRAQRALKALGEHPRSSKKELGHAREHVNACYSQGSGEYVWNAVAQVEAMAERRYGVPSAQEQVQVAEAREDIEEPATAARGRAAEDRAIPSTSLTTDVELAPTTSR